LISVFVK